MPDGIKPQILGQRGLDEIARVMDGANVIIHGLDGVISHWTEGCRQLYGWRAGTGCRTERARAFCARCFRSRSTTFAPRCGQRGVWKGELTHRHKDGDPISFASRWVALIHESRQGLVIVQTNNDITGLRQAQGDLAEREAHLRSILDTVPEAMVVIDPSGTVDFVQRGGAEAVRLRRGRGAGPQRQNADALARPRSP